eukprot:CAMPEP_0176126272 /NCGR_PEP_ID=MMETSP0120_2-20121206/63726_1 /TAXON_ID=160619 /ORGANISM="Kryptoperidinium foliaceum, Strain CCMP 1326" /LENGTH=90 /DNA_ID=CAMNT_0017461185 /DNA_START=85 /DNA_END=357 /DNA_ORIENTATION=+
MRRFLGELRERSEEVHNEMGLECLYLRTEFSPIRGGIQPAAQGCDCIETSLHIHPAEASIAITIRPPMPLAEPAEHSLALVVLAVEDSLL